ncbi:hypothetical protein PRO82_001471 [Candidatus Protochlamydia amoebophila]|nr:hypothetical protein [Candidatus Protochlamydia amoebophila]
MVNNLRFIPTKQIFTLVGRCDLVRYHTQFKNFSSIFYEAVGH